MRHSDAFTSRECSFMSPFQAAAKRALDTPWETPQRRERCHMDQGN